MRDEDIAESGKATADREVEIATAFAARHKMDVELVVSGLRAVTVSYSAMRAADAAVAVSSAGQITKSTVRDLLKAGHTTLTEFVVLSLFKDDAPKAIEFLDLLKKRLVRIDAEIQSLVRP